MEHNANMDYKTCPTCRKEIGYYEAVCPHCGQTFQMEYHDERIPYIKSNADTYLKKFNKMEQKNSIISWNWCAFLFTTRWLVYRKMYLLGILVYAGFLAAGFVLGVILAMVTTTIAQFDIGLAVGSIILTLALCLGVGLLGDYWYKKKIDKLAAQGSGMPEGQEKQRHIKKGGTSILALILFLLVMIVIEYLL